MIRPRVSSRSVGAQFCLLADFARRRPAEQERKTVPRERNRSRMGGGKPIREVRKPPHDPACLRAFPQKRLTESCWPWMNARGDRNQTFVLSLSSLFSI